jgi:hypothetical protein
MAPSSTGVCLGSEAPFVPWTHETHVLCRASRVRAARTVLPSPSGADGLAGRADDVSIYLTDSSLSLDVSTTTASGVSLGSLSNYSEVGKGSGNSSPRGVLRKER